MGVRRASCGCWRSHRVRGGEGRGVGLPTGMSEGPRAATRTWTPGALEPWPGFKTWPS